MTAVPWLRSSPPLAQVHDVALLDLDGVVYVGEQAVPHAVKALDAATGLGMRTAFVTNNASRPAAEVAGHLRALGLSAADTDVVTSAQAGARLVADRVPAGASVLALGGPGVVEALRERGLRPMGSDAERPAAVLQGFGPDVGWRLLAEGAYALARGVPWVATNLDLTIPTAGGIAPGNGALVGLLARHSGRDPVVAGKPEPPLLRESVVRTGADRPLMVGDRLDTDIEGASRAGMPALLVLTGVSGVRDVLCAPAAQRPTYLSTDLRGLLVAHPAPLRGGDPGEWRCADAKARVQSGRLDVSPTGDRMDALRAAAAAMWSAVDDGAVDVDCVDAVRRLTEWAG